MEKGTPDNSPASLDLECLLDATSPGWRKRKFKWKLQFSLAGLFIGVTAASMFVAFLLPLPTSIDRFVIVPFCKRRGRERDRIVDVPSRQEWIDASKDAWDRSNNIAIMKAIRFTRS